MKSYTELAIEHGAITGGIDYRHSTGVTSLRLTPAQLTATIEAAFAQELEWVEPVAYVWHQHLGEKTKSLRWRKPNQWEYAKSVDALYPASLVAALKADKERLEARVAGLEKAVDLLEEFITLYEDGPDCYEDPEDFSGHLGKAVRLSDESLDAACDLLNAQRPRAALTTKDSKE